MITNERQLQMSKAQAERFRDTLVTLESGSLDTTTLHPLVKKAQVDAVRGQLESIECEIQEYEALRSGQVTEISLNSLAALPEGLIRARIAAGLTQRELAERLGMREQQIQRYEATRYDGATFNRMVDVADAIGVKVRKRLSILKSTSLEAVLKRLELIGLSREFIQKRIVLDIGLIEKNQLAIAHRVSHTFGWSPDVLFSTGAIDLAGFGGASARFKMPKSRNARATTIYTAYAYRLAEICAKAMIDKPREQIPIDWQEFRQLLIARYTTVDFRSALAMAWDLGIVVLPLNDPAAFHGACWRIGGVNVIALKQPLHYPARWLFDLVHEMRHAGEFPEQTEFEVLEGSEVSEERRTSESEKLASWFSGQVLLNGRAEELVKEALEIAGGDIRRLKSAIELLGERHSVTVSHLANYLAFRLSLQGENWWGVAANLQDKTYDPLQYARQLFFDRFPFAGIKDADLQLLSLALHDEHNEVDHGGQRTY